MMAQLTLTAALSLGGQMARDYPKTNAAGLRIIKHHESCQTEAYQCPAGVWTIGYGTTGPNIGPGLEWSVDECERALKTKVKDIERRLQALIKVPVSDNQFSALVSLAYNIGIGAFATSTLLKKLNNQDYEGAAREFIKWNKATNQKTGKKEVLPGLVRRRADEAYLFIKDVIYLITMNRQFIQPATLEFLEKIQAKKLLTEYQEEIV